MTWPILLVDLRVQLDVSELIKSLGYDDFNYITCLLPSYSYILRGFER